MKLSKKVLVFGVFDGLHPGHLSFLRQAEKHGDLIIAVARDAIVKKMKNKKPAQTERQRIAALKKSFPKASVFLGDKTQGSYTIAKGQKPDIICLGYDQTELARDLAEKMKKGELPVIKMITLKPLRSGKFKTTILTSSSHSE